MAAPEISIVIGTWNRLEALKGCIALCRRSTQTIPYEMIVVDGGSTDGTLEWLQDQKDVTTICQGRLVGACRAFTAGFRLARAPFVVHLNDDDEPQDDCIAQAYKFMKANPDVGQVAFAFDLYTPGQYHHETVFGQPYANKGMTRRELGDRAAWWIDSNRWEEGHWTYAGDCELSCRIWEMGYRVVPLHQCRVHDLATKDELRKANNPTGQNPDSAKFYKRRRGIAKPTRFPRRVLHVALNVPNDNQPALVRALRSMGEYRQFDWRENQGEAKHLIPEIVQEYDPTLVFMQIQTPEIVTRETMRQIAAPHRKIVNWSGDVRNKIDPWYFQIGREIDLTLFTNMGWVQNVRSSQIKANYLQIGFNQEEYNPWLEPTPCEEIIFLGSHYGFKFPVARTRFDMVQFLKKRYRGRFQAYGNGWQFETVHLRHKEESAHYRGCKIAVGISQFDLSRYTSDRLHRAMGAGAFYLTKTYPQIEEEFKAGTHLETWKNLNELGERIDYHLGHDEERRQLAFQGSEYIHEWHTWLDRSYQLAEMIGWHQWK